MEFQSGTKALREAVEWSYMGNTMIWSPKDVKLIFMVRKGIFALLYLSAELP